MFKSLSLTLICALLCCITITAQTVTKSAEIKLPGGISYVTYELKADIKVKTELPFDTATFKYSVAWPTNGPQNVVDQIRRWIIESVKKSEFLEEYNYNVDTINIENLLKQIFHKSYSGSFDENDKMYNGDASDNLSVQIKEENGVIEVSRVVEIYSPPTRPYWESENLILLKVNNDFKPLTYSMFPPISKMRPILLNHMRNADGPLTDADMLFDPDFDYPESLPTIEGDKLVFIWDCEEIAPRIVGQLDSYVPKAEILPLASPDLRRYLGEEPANASYDVKDSLSIEVAASFRKLQELQQEYNKYKAEGDTENAEKIDKECRNLILEITKRAMQDPDFARALQEFSPSNRSNQ